MVQSKERRQRRPHPETSDTDHAKQMSVVSIGKIKLNMKTLVLKNALTKGRLHRKKNLFFGHYRIRVLGVGGSELILTLVLG